jgi:hypothetical protein
MPTNSKEYMRSYYHLNKEKFLDKVECEVCGSRVARMGMAAHKRTAKHQKHLRQLHDDLKRKHHQGDDSIEEPSSESS